MRLRIREVTFVGYFSDGGDILLNINDLVTTIPVMYLVYLCTYVILLEVSEPFSCWELSLYLSYHKESMKVCCALSVLYPKSQQEVSTNAIRTKGPCKVDYQS